MFSGTLAQTGLALDQFYYLLLIKSSAGKGINGTLFNQ